MDFLQNTRLLHMIVIMFGLVASSWCQYYGRLVPCPRSYMDPDGDCVVGIASKDYPTYSTIPLTSFSCLNHRVHYIGYFADQQTHCQVYHVCRSDGLKDTFLCPNGTIFNQRFLVCDWWFNVKCQDSPQYYGLNDYLHPPIIFKKVPISPNVTPINIYSAKLSHQPNDNQRPTQIVAPPKSTSPIKNSTAKYYSSTVRTDISPSSSNSNDFTPIKNPQTRSTVSEDKSFKSGTIHR